MKIPTMRELERAARKIGAVVDEGHTADGDDAIFVIDRAGLVTGSFPYIASYPGARARARYLTGQDIKALKRMQGAGL